MFGAYSSSNDQSDLFLARPSGQVVPITNNIWDENYMGMGDGYAAWYSKKTSVSPWQYGVFVCDLAHGTATVIQNWREPAR